MIAWGYFGFRINVHTWESYYYTGCLDNFIQARDMRPPTMNLELPYEKLICLHYTQHPILYYSTYLICKSFFSLKDGIIIVQLLNIFSGIIACLICYHVCLLMSRSRILSICLMLLIAFSDIYWYQSLSGEVYIQPFLFLVLSYYFLVKSTSNKQSGNKQIVIASICAGSAMSFHMFSALFYIVILYYLIETNRNNSRIHLSYMTGISAFIMLIFFCFTYVVPYVIIFQFNSISDWFHLVFLHNHNWGIWHVPVKFIFFEVIWSFFVGIRHLLHSFVSGFHIISILFRILILIIFSQTLWYFISRDINKKIEIKALLIWILIYFTFITINVPMVNDYWCFITFPMAMFIVINLKQQMRFNTLFYFLVLTICFIITMNFINDIYPKNKIQQEEYFVIAQAEKSIESASHIVMIGNNNLLSETWYLHQQYQDKKFFYHAPDTQFKSKDKFLKSFKNLIQRINKDIFVLILDGSERDVVRISRFIKQLHIKLTPLFRKTGTYQASELKIAIGLINKPINITLYGFQVKKS
jgi:hypothetical protein